MAGDRIIPWPLIRGALVTVGGVLDDARIPWCAIGSLAKPLERNHTDVDLCIRPVDVDRALTALREAQLPAFEYLGWMVKTYVGSVLVDLIFCPEGVAADDLIRSATATRYEQMRVPMASEYLVSFSQRASGK